jgi:hypothetical protein
MNFLCCSLHSERRVIIVSMWIAVCACNWQEEVTRLGSGIPTKVGWMESKQKIQRHNLHFMEIWNLIYIFKFKKNFFTYDISDVRHLRFPNINFLIQVKRCDVWPHYIISQIAVGLRFDIYIYSVGLQPIHGSMRRLAIA